jgi:hypothetical protein
MKGKKYLKKPSAKKQNKQHPLKKNEVPIHCFENKQNILQILYREGHPFLFHM